MKKILLLEDRTYRQVRACNNASLELSKYEDELENATNQRYEAHFQSLENDSFKVDAYKAIIAHKSGFGDDNQAMLHKLEQLCKKSGIPLIYFSGGISLVTFMHTEELEKLEINSKVLYSNNLKLFLEHFQQQGEIELMILGYGKSWKLNILLNTLEKINLFMARNNKEDVLYEDFANQTDFNLLEKTIREDEIKAVETENGWVEYCELESLQKALEQLVEQRILHER